ncbi:VOC family protein [Actinokineospora sp.]|uniref:VOC family protein n=1 Tax=Actinokineospora sp. TaxID=1872133 RepID=UPI004037D312
MTSRIHNIAFDCADSYVLAQWWSQVVGHPVHPDDRPGDDEVIIELPAGPTLFFNQVPEAKTVKNRVHLCLRPDIPRDEEVARLLGAGAVMVSDLREPDGRGWAVLADPEGNEFCILRGP